MNYNVSYIKYSKLGRFRIFSYTKPLKIKKTLKNATNFEYLLYNSISRPNGTIHFILWSFKLWKNPGKNLRLDHLRISVAAPDWTVGVAMAVGNTSELVAQKRLLSSTTGNHPPPFNTSRPPTNVTKYPSTDGT